MRHLLRLSISLALAGVVLGGCAGGEYAKTSRGAVADGSVEVSVYVRGTAGAALYANHVLQNRLSSAISSYVGRPITLSITPNKVGWSGPLSYKQLRSSGAITGIRSVEVSGNSGLTTVSMSLGYPTALRDALLGSAYSASTPEASPGNIEELTTVGVMVTFEGSVAVVSSTGPRVHTHNGVAAVYQNLLDFQGGRFVIRGSGRNYTHFYALLVIIGALLAWGLFVVRRRHTPRM